MAQADQVLLMKADSRIVRVLLPDGIGTVEITTGLHIGDAPRIRVDVTSDQPRYGDTALDGLVYTARNNPDHDGIVYLDGEQP